MTLCQPCVRVKAIVRCVLSLHCSDSNPPTFLLIVWAPNPKFIPDNWSDGWTVRWRSKLSKIPRIMNTRCSPPLHHRSPNTPTSQNIPDQAGRTLSSLPDTRLSSVLRAADIAAGSGYNVQLTSRVSTGQYNNQLQFHTRSLHWLGNTSPRDIIAGLDRNSINIIYSLAKLYKIINLAFSIILK